jgi:hypothetical protein
VPKEKFANALFIIFGVILALGVSIYRQISGGAFEVRWSEVILLILPLLLWSLASGQFESFRISSTGVQIKTAIQRAASKQIIINDKVLRFIMPNASGKESISGLYDIQRQHPESLNFQLRTDNYYDSNALMEYVYRLSDTAGFKYFLFFDKVSSKQFLGGISAPELCRSLEMDIVDTRAPTAGQEGQARLSVSTLTEVLNCKKDFDFVRRLHGFVGREQSLRKSDDKRTALTRMDELGTTWLPVVDRNKLIGVVERPELAAGLLLDVVKALEGRGNA